MTRDDAVARIQRGLGFRTDLFDEIVTALIEARRNLETGKSLPDFLLQVDQVLTVAAGEDDPSFPDRFLREFQEESFHYTLASEPDNVIWLEKLDFNIAQSRFIHMDPGPPLAYTIRANGFQLWPEPDIGYALQWSYYKKSVPLDTNVSDNEWLADDDGAPEALIGRAGQIIAGDLNDQVSLQKFSAMYNAAMGAILAESQLLDEENRPLAVGSRL